MLLRSLLSEETPWENQGEAAYKETRLIAGDLPDLLTRLRRYHVDKVAQRLMQVKGVTNVQVHAERLEESFQFSWLGFTFKGNKLVIRFSISGYSLQPDFANKNSTTWKAIEAALSKIPPAPD